MEAIIRNAEESYQQGLGELRYGRPGRALPLFRKAITISSEAAESDKARARYLSFCGVCVYRTGGRLSEAYSLCKRAVELDTNNAGLWRNLAKIAQAAGRQGQAHRALRHALGLGLSPGHLGILQDLRKLGFRRKPVLHFLSRSNPFNVLCGRILQRISPPARPGVAAPAVRVVGGP